MDCEQTTRSRVSLPTLRRRRGSRRDISTKQGYSSCSNRESECGPLWQAQTTARSEQATSGINTSAQELERSSLAFNYKRAAKRGLDSQPVTLPERRTTPPLRGLMTIGQHFRTTLMDHHCREIIFIHCEVLYCQMLSMHLKATSSPVFASPHLPT